LTNRLLTLALLAMRADDSDGCRRWAWYAVGLHLLQLVERGALLLDRVIDHVERFIDSVERVLSALCHQ
jgi:hypothetical protein